MKKKNIIILLTILFSYNILSGTQFIYDFLKFPKFPEYYSLGNPAALDLNIGAIDINPAGIFSGRSQIYASHTEYFQGFRSELIGYSTFLKKSGNQMCFVLNYIYSYPFKKTIILDGYYEEGSYSLYYLSPVLGFSSKLYDYIYIGVILRYNYINISSEFIKSQLLDFGILLKNVFNKLNIGISLQNLGFTKISYSLKKDSVSKKFNLGLKYKFSNSIYIFSDFHYPIKYLNYDISLGISLFVIKNLNIRCGYRYYLRNNEPDNIFYGLGYNLTERFNINWAGSSFGDLGIINLFAIEYIF